MHGQVSNELEVDVPACKVWEIYGTKKLPQLIQEALKDFVEKVEFVGDGGVGSTVKLVFVPGVIPGITWYKEKYTKVDNENRVKETEDEEGGYLDLGFTLYRVRFEIIEKDKDSSIIKSNVEYDLKDEAAANASIISIAPYAKLAQAAKEQLIKTKA